jgi:glycosyltransferase involved in cell wall biosynthesis
MTADVLVIVPSITSYATFLAGLPSRAWDAGIRIHLAAGPAIHVGDVVPIDSLAGRLDLPAIRGGGAVEGVRAVMALRQLIAETRPRVVHAHFAAAAVVAAATRALLPRCNATWMATFHGLSGGIMAGKSDAKAATGRVAGWEVWAARRHDIAYVLNREDAEWLHDMVPAADVRLNQVFLGCDLTQFSRSRFTPADRIAIRRRLGISPESPTAVFIGRQVAFKGFATAIRAFWLARERLPECRLMLVGERDPVHPSGLDAAELQRLRSDSAIAACGWQPDVSDYLAASDVCLFPSEREGMPVCLMEALSMGVPCVTSDSRGCRDVVRNEIDGCVVPGADPAAYATAVCGILSSEARREEMRRYALEGRSRFDRTAFLDDQVRNYLDLIKAAS